MSMVEERALAEIIVRLATIDGARVEIEPPDDNPDAGLSYPAIAVLPGDAEAELDQQLRQVVVTVPLMIRGLTLANPEEGNDDLPKTPRTVGYALLAKMLAALFPVQKEAFDRLGGAAKKFTYTGHAIYPHDDGGNTVGVFIDTEVEYVLHLNNPDQ